MARMEMLLQELLRRTPATQRQGEIVYSYATAKTVAELRQLKGLNMSHFVLALEVEVYNDDTTELELLVDNRIRTKDRCLFKYYDIPEHLREGTWRKAKESLNSRVRRLRKTIRDGQLTQSQNRLHSSRQGSQDRRVPLQQRENNPRPIEDTYYFDDE
ncbi:hypothetical protein Aduo_001713 [Ancylostoma duodenale]